MIAALLAVAGLLALTFYLLHSFGRERNVWAKERRLLNACIQRPSLTVQAHHEDEEEPQEPVILGADGDFYQDGKPV